MEDVLLHEDEEPGGRQGPRPGRSPWPAQRSTPPAANRGGSLHGQASWGGLQTNGTGHLEHTGQPQGLSVVEAEVVAFRLVPGQVALGDRLVGVRAHAEYNVRVTGSDGSVWMVQRRYREFMDLHWELVRFLECTQPQQGQGIGGRAGQQVPGTLLLPREWSEAWKEGGQLVGTSSTRTVERRRQLLHSCLAATLAAGQGRPMGLGLVSVHPNSRQARSAPMHCCGTILKRPHDKAIESAGFMSRLGSVLSFLSRSTSCQACLLSLPSGPSCAARTVLACRPPSGNGPCAGALSGRGPNGTVPGHGRPGAPTARRRRSCQCTQCRSQCRRPWAGSLAGKAPALASRPSGSAAVSRSAPRQRGGLRARGCAHDCQAKGRGPGCSGGCVGPRDGEWSGSSAAGA